MGCCVFYYSPHSKNKYILSSFPWVYFLWKKSDPWQSLLVFCLFLWSSRSWQSRVHQMSAPPLSKGGKQEMYIWRGDSVLSSKEQVQGSVLYMTILTVLTENEEIHRCVLDLTLFNFFFLSFAFLMHWHKFKFPYLPTWTCLAELSVMIQWKENMFNQWIFLRLTYLSSSFSSLL